MQKKEYRRNIFYMLSLVFALLFLNLGCQREDLNSPLASTYNIKTVSKSDAFNYLNSQLVTARNSNETYITQMGDSIIYDPLINSDELMATLTVATMHQQAYSRILMLEINDSVQSVVYSMYSNNNFSTETFYGSALIADFQGNVMSGFKIENDYYVSQYVFPENYVLQQTASRSTGGDDYVWDDGSLDEIVLTATKKININIIYCSYCHLVGGDGGSSNESIDEGVGWGGGGSSQTACPTGYVKDDSDNCVLITPFDPCDEIQQQIDNANHQAKVEYLEGKTGDTIEHGFKQMKTGIFASLNTFNSGHSLDFGNFTNAIGYLHTHTDEYFTGVYDKNNNPQYKKSYKMFSPYDLRTFLLLVKNAQQDSGINVGDIYGTVITSSGNYTLKFTGNPISINTNFNPKALKEKYEEIIKKYGKERGFLKFIKEVTNNNGVSLYEIKDNGTVKEIYLDENDKKQSENCD